jgi:hypothetical protein
MQGNDNYVDNLDDTATSTIIIDTDSIVIDMQGNDNYVDNFDDTATSTIVHSCSSDAVTEISDNTIPSTHKHLDTPLKFLSINVCGLRNRLNYPEFCRRSGD